MSMKHTQMCSLFSAGTCSACPSVSQTHPPTSDRNQFDVSVHCCNQACIYEQLRRLPIIVHALIEGFELLWSFLIGFFQSACGRESKSDKGACSRHAQEQVRGCEVDGTDVSMAQDVTVSPSFKHDSGFLSLLLHSM